MKGWILKAAGTAMCAAAILAAEPAKKPDAPAAKELTYANVVSDSASIPVSGRRSAPKYCFSFVRR